MASLPRAYFDEESSADVVAGQNVNAKDARLRAIMDSIIHHLHACIKDVEPTPQEWLQAIQFLTETGHMCDDWRQEFILLSDVLGVSMLVDAINARRPKGATENTVLGPFHIDAAPEYPMGTNICLDAKGDDLVVHGCVRSIDGRPLTDVKMDVWQANDDGFYDIQQKGIQPAFNLRGVFRTGEEGHYWFKAVRPKHYAIPDDGPVGRLLENLGRHPWRPAHLHFILSKEGYETVTTHIFDPDDPYIGNDAVFGVKESLLGNFQKIDAEDKRIDMGFDGTFYWDLEFDFRMAPQK